MNNHLCRKEEKFMGKLVSEFVDYLIVNEMICKDMREMHIYGLEVMTGKILNYGTLLLLSWRNGNIFQTLIFMVTFFSLRSRNGGFHAKKFMHCYLGTVVIYFCVSQIIVPIMIMHKHVVLYIVIVSIVAVFLFALINHPDLQLSDDEILMCKNSARRLVIYISICVTVLVKLNIIPDYIYYVIAGMGMNTGLLLIAKILKQEVGQ